MSDEKKDINLDRIIESDSERKRKKHRERQTLKFQDYIKLVEQDPKIAQNAPSRLLEQIMSYGTEPIPPDEQWFTLDNGQPVDVRYLAFSKQLFGIDKPIFQVVQYLKAAANRLSTGKQILLLVGPTASGKSTFVTIIKKLLESYSLRPVYCIQGCPMHEEPLHLLPRYAREEFSRKLGMRITGDLCPHCRHKLAEEFTNKDDGVVRWWDVPVENFTFSNQGGRGIGSFEPGSEMQDVTELGGHLNIAVSSKKGESHPLAWELSGEIPRGNRGICECRELIKADPKLLRPFISIAEEQEMKVQGSNFPHLSLDLVVIGHTNLTEYKKFAARKENEALHDRIYVIQFPYPLRVDDEERVYEKLIERESDFVSLTNCHISPGALRIAALTADLTRLVESQSGVDLLTKVMAYNGDKAITELRDKDKQPIDIRTLIDEGQASPDIAKREGMFGMSSRDSLAAINTELVKKGNGCLTMLAVIRALRNVFEHRMGYTPEEIERACEIITTKVMGEYRSFVLRSVSRAFLRAYKDLAHELFGKYIREAEFYRDQKRKHVRGGFDVRRDDMGKPKEPNVKLLRSIEEHIPISESEAEVFRGEILEFKAQNPDFGYDTYPPLARAVEEKLLTDSKASLTVVLASDKPKGEEERRRAQDLFDALTGDRGAGFCQYCAREIIEKATEFLSE